MEQEPVREAVGLQPGDARLRRYVSRLHLAKIAARPPGSPRPTWERASAAVLWIDVSGFTALTNTLASKGPLGAEEVSQVMSGYFGRITDMATGTGGDVISYAGDGALVLWSEHTAGGLETATGLAAQAGLAIQQEFGGFALIPGVSLGLRVSIGAGTVTIVEVGGVDGAWQLLVAGGPVLQAMRADRQSKVGDVLLSPEAWSQVSEWAVGTALDTSAVRLDSLTRPFSPRGERADPRLTSDDALKPYVPEVVLDQLAADQERWLGEFRNVSVMFVSLRGPPIEDAETLPGLHDVVASIQKEIRRQEGRVYQFLVDDKGTTLITAFGLPPRAHVDDAARCVDTSLAILDGLAGSDVRPDIGIATGPAYCGVYGGWDRRQYAVVGPVMNRASRIAQHADGVLCDEATALGAASHRALRFHALASLKLKGETAEVPVFEPEHAPQEEARSRTVIGRRREQEIFARSIERLAGERAGGAIVVQGDEGFGKSVLIEDFVRRAGRAGVRCLVGQANEIEGDTPYFVWRSIVAELLDLREGEWSESALRGQVRELLPGEERLWALVPLLGDVLPIDLDDGPLTSRMQGEVRAENTRRILLALLQRAAAASPLSVVLEDAHWADSASWSLLVQVVRQIPEILLVLGVRPVERPPDGLLELVEMPESHRLALERLSREEVRGLLADRLEMPDVPAAVVDLIYDQAAGHPFFSEELGYALRDQGVLGVEGGEDGAQPLRDPEDLEEALRGWTVPTTVQSAITNRFDRLTTEELLTLRTASAIGRSFPISLLRDVYPLDSGRPHVAEHLETLVRLDLARLVSEEPEVTYGFKHVITQDVAYNSMLFAQRRELHRGIAEWYETRHGPDAPHLFAVFGHHWRQAGVPEKASGYLGRAGERALRQYANREASHLLTEALAVAEDGGVAPDQQAAWRLQLGRAYVNWSKYEEALPHLERGISSHGQPAPRHPVAATLRLFGQLLRQAAHRLWPSRFVGRNVRDRDRLLPLIPAYEGLVETHYIAGSTMPCLYAAVRSLNLAESVGPSVELARGYASFGAIMGFVPVHRVAEAYCRRAVDTARAVRDPLATAWVHLATGVYRAGKGEWEEAVELFEGAARVSEELGDRRRWEDCTQHLATVSCLRGEFERALRLADRLRASSLGGSGSPLSAADASEAHVARQVAALRIRAHCLLSTGSFDEAMGCVEELRALLRGRSAAVVKSVRLILPSIEALSHVHLLEPREAQEAAREAVQQFRASGVSSYDLHLEYAAAAEACFTLIDGSSGDDGRVEAESRRAVKALSSHARVFPIGRPAADLWRGVLLWHRGRGGKSFAAWRRSISASRALRMPLVEGLARLQIGRRLDAGSEERERQLVEAESLFGRIGARHHLARAQALLEEG